MKYLVILVALLLLLSACHQSKPAQSLSKTAKVDSLFQKYQAPDSPGYALGIIEDGALLYSKGYGMANLEHGIPLSDSSAIYIGSMAKQFTTAALLILESQGKIDLSKPVKEYLPEFPVYADTITVNHLIHHTSGIRETNSMQLFQGIDRNFEEVFDTGDLYELILQQENLNFKPGSEFRYSSGGYAVLAKMVERMTEKDFRSYLNEVIFEPLGMKNTFVSDNRHEIVPNRAASYWPTNEGTYELRNQLFEAYGDGGIITTVKDLAKWDRAFYEDLLGVEDFAQKMYNKGTLENGEEIEYARALQVRNYKGLQMITHNGGMLGFRVDMVRFPEIKTSFILLGNSAYLDPTGDILKIADIWLDAHFAEIPATTQKKTETSEIKVAPETLTTYTGYYWTDEANYYRRITLRNDSLFLDSGNPDFASYLMPISQTEFLIKDFFIPARFKFDPKNIKKELTAIFGNTHRNFRKFDPTPPASIEDLIPYLGSYRSEELSSTYRIYKDSGRIYLQINRKKPLQLFPVPTNSNVVWNGKKMVWIGFGELKFEFENPNTVSALYIGDARVSGIRFDKE
ncbi:serine hydrolase domain-containing protein [Flavobacteriaceae bacterium M23B6Z8]